MGGLPAVDDTADGAPAAGLLAVLGTAAVVEAVERPAPGMGTGCATAALPLPLTSVVLAAAVRLAELREDVASVSVEAAAAAVPLADCDDQPKK